MIITEDEAFSLKMLQEVENQKSTDIDLSNCTFVIFGDTCIVIPEKTNFENEEELNKEINFIKDRDNIIPLKFQYLIDSLTDIYPSTTRANIPFYHKTKGVNKPSKKVNLIFKKIIFNSQSSSKELDKIFKIEEGVLSFNKMNDSRLIRNSIIISHISRYTIETSLSVTSVYISLNIFTSNTSFTFNFPFSTDLDKAKEIDDFMKAMLNNKLDNTLNV